MSNTTVLNEKTYVEVPFLEHLKRLGWDVVYGNDGRGHRSDLGEVLIKDEVTSALASLNPWLTAGQVDDLYIELSRFQSTDAYLRNRNYEGDGRLIGGLSAYDEAEGENRIVKLIDFDPCNIDSNRFLAVSQFRVRHLEKEIIPDIVLFVNGIPLVVVECKSPSNKEPFFEAVKQIERYRGVFKSLFYYNQFVVLTYRHEAKYATVTGEAGDYLEWKDPYPFDLSEIEAGGGVVTSQERLVWGMLSRGNLLDIIGNYIVWDAEVKKAPRYMQYRGARKLVEKFCAQRSGGTIWHTQGSGKSLTMMYVIRQMYHSKQFADWKIVLIVDRDDLEKQLRGATNVVGYDVGVARSISDCEKRIRSNASDVTIVMIHKFGTVDGVNFGVLNTSKKILIMVDEAHRSQYKELAASMDKAMPNAVKVAFTGTPITKTLETFGGIIDKYSMRQAVEDGVVVEIRYEGRATESVITDEDAMNGKFADVFDYADDDEKRRIMNRYTFSGYMEAEDVIRAKAKDMLDHYVGTIFTNGFKAQVAAYNRLAAYRYKCALEILLAEKIAELKRDNPMKVDIERLGRLKVECVISADQRDANDYPDLKRLTDNTDIDKVKREFKRGFGDSGGGDVGIIVVSDMLLTGFDAPIEQVLYLDKKLTNHNLLQAIARVNRVCGPDKKCGYVVDYVGITNHLKEALAEFADAEEEPAEVLIDVSKDIDRLNSAYNEIMTFVRGLVDCGDIYEERHIQLIIEELVADENLREEFNLRFKILARYYDRVLPRREALEYRDDIKRLSFIRQAVANRTRDPRFSMKDASAKVRAIIEEYLEVEGVGTDVPPIDILSADFIAGIEKKGKSDRAVVDELIFAIREHINDNSFIDPELYERFSERLQQILDGFNGCHKEQRRKLLDLRDDMGNARKNEENYGYDPMREMPFFALLRKEVFDSRKFDELTGDEFDALKSLTDVCLSILKEETVKIDFWDHNSQVNEMRTKIRKLLWNIEHIVPSITEKQNDIVQKIVELGRIHYK